MLYRLLKFLLGLGMRLYYREILILNKGALSGKGPRIIIANHPNTMLDAWIIGYACKEPVYYMTKGTFFNTSFKKKLLMYLGLIPINRAVDNKTSGVSNVDSFELCYQVLEQGKTLVIFPEGNSQAEKLLRMLKSGAARIALETERRNNGTLGLKIIPIGLVYLQPEKFRSSVLATVGAAISPLPYLDEFKVDSLRAARRLTDDFRVGLTALLVESEDRAKEDLADQIRAVLSASSELKSGKKLVEDVELIKIINRSLNRMERNEPEKYRKVETLVAQLNWLMKRHRIQSDFLDRNYRFALFFRQLIQSGLLLILAFPLFLFGFVHNIIPFKFTDLIMPKLVESKEYYAPIAILLGLFLYPLNYTAFFLVAIHFVGIEFTIWTFLIYLAAMPLSGLFAHFFYTYFNYLSVKWRFIQLMRSTKKQTIMSELKSLRQELRAIVLINNQ